MNVCSDAAALKIGAPKLSGSNLILFSLNINNL